MTYQRLVKQKLVQHNKAQLLDVNYVLVIIVIMIRILMQKIDLENLAKVLKYFIVIRN